MTSKELIKHSSILTKVLRGTRKLLQMGKKEVPKLAPISSSLQRLRNAVQRMQP